MIGAVGMMPVHAQERTVQHMLPFAEIVKWGQSSTTLALVQRVAEGDTAARQWHFSTSQSHEMDRVLCDPPRAPFPPLALGLGVTSGASVAQGRVVPHSHACTVVTLTLTLTQAIVPTHTEQYVTLDCPLACNGLAWSASRQKLDRCGGIWRLR
jgi:hypothetical protein